ncbi:MAG: bifunctional diguanylate cyclase/phosphodiesterase [Phenylobacterium zucineum]|nr:MAG: bifunctional diguanylate cyclase/phosphodiesterase [Phenylobacterium zucineum]
MVLKLSEAMLRNVLLLLVGIAGIVLLVCSFLNITARADLHAATRDRQLVAHGVEGWIRDQEIQVKEQVDWDKARQNLVARQDARWVSANIGQLFFKSLKMDHAFVLNGADQPIYAMVKGADMPAKAYFRLAGDSRPLVRRLRALETGRLQPEAPASDGQVTSGPIQVSEIVMSAGKPTLVTASLVRPDSRRAYWVGPAPIIIAKRDLDDSFVKALADRFQVRNLHIQTDNLNRTPAHGGYYILKDGRGHDVGRLDWTPEGPGHQMLANTIPPVVACLVILSLFAGRLLIRTYRASQALLASESRARHMAFHDSLTGLPNRVMFNDRVAQALAHQRRDGPIIGVLSLDLDRFKDVNDSYGHQAGDELITAVAARISPLCRMTDTVIRLGGDEFAILQVGASANSLAILADRVINSISQPFDLQAGRVFVGASIGATLISDPNCDVGEILRQSDLAMYRAKANGRGRYAFYEPEMDQALKQRRALESDLRAALATESLTMVYQPQADAAGNVAGVEALVRWVHQERGPISPGHFVPIAEECGLIEVLGEFTMRQAFKDSLRWPGLSVAVNVSAVQLRDQAFLQKITAMVKDTGANPNQIELEITEGVLLADDEAVHRTLASLRTMGFSLALDDFGTGYSSLAYLRRYPIDKIKIDRSFVVNLGVEKDAEALVGAIVKMARALDLDVIAEGVETDSQRAGLRRAGCGNIQGYLFSRPIHSDDVEALLGDRKSVTDWRRAS